MTDSQQPPQIEEFAKIIESKLNGGKLISFKCRYLTKPGDNYGSIMLAVTTQIQTNTNGNIEELELVAKLPPGSQDFWDLFQPERTCITETKCYTVLAPALIKLQIDAGIKENEIIDVFPKCYGARYNLNDTTTTNNNNNDNGDNGCSNDLKAKNKDDEIVDKNATLVLENLCASGYKIGDRFNGFDYYHTIIILRDLAYFHALPIALRQSNPVWFKNHIFPFIKKFDLGENFKEELRLEFNKSTENALRIANIDENDINYILDLMELDYQRNKRIEQCSDGPYITVVHSDFWVNNMMILYDENGRPDKIKIVDFQIAQYERLVNDLIFFLFTSVQANVLEEKCVEFLHHYYENFVSCLNKVNCNTSEYTFENFMNEITSYAYLQIPHVIMMLRILFLKRDILPSFDELDPNQLTDDSGMDQRYYVKIKNVIKLFKKLQWFRKGD